VNINFTAYIRAIRVGKLFEFRWEEDIYYVSPWKIIKVMWPTYPYRRKIRKKVEPETLEGSNWPLEQQNAATYFIYYLFISFAVLPYVNTSWVMDWITFIGLQKPQELGSGKITLFLLHSSSNISTDKTEEQWIIGEIATEYIILVSYDLNLTTLGCKHYQSVNWYKRSKKLLQTSTSQICWPFKPPFSRQNIGQEQWIRECCSGYQNSGKFRFESKYLGPQLNYSQSLNWGKR